MNTRSIDLNSDLGEGYGPWRMADDEAILEIVSSANIACGAHAGDPMQMRLTLRRAKALGATPGAHIGYPDRQGFGRRPMALTLEELEVETLTQLGALTALAQAEDMRLSHANFHGALGNLAMVDTDVARVLIAALKTFDRDLAFVGLPGTAAAREADRQGLRLVNSFLADRAYTPQATLVARGTAGAVIHDPEAISARLTRLLGDGTVEAIDGTVLHLPVDSILIHSDTEGAVALAHTIADAVKTAGCKVQPLTRSATTGLIPPRNERP